MVYDRQRLFSPQACDSSKKLSIDGSVNGEKMSLTQPSCDLSSAAADSATRPTPRLWFVTEIQQMM